MENAFKGTDRLVKSHGLTRLVVSLHSFLRLENIILKLKGHYQNIISQLVLAR